MRLARALLDATSHHLVGEAGRWFTTAPILPGSAPTGEVIARWDDIARALSAGDLPELSVGEEDLLAAVHRPSKIVAMGLNYTMHAEENDVAVPASPIAFAKFPSSLAGPRDQVVIDHTLTTQCDYEVELAVVIGRRTRSIALQDALSAVFGYAVANDVSARDHQFSDGQWDRSKSFDTFCPLGPWITTADTVADPGSLGLSARVNGEVRQSASTGEMIFDTAYLIHYLSRGMTLEPGDVILTGTPSGVGLGMRPPSFLAPGDVVRCEVEGLGVLENAFVAAEVRL